MNSSRRWIVAGSAAALLGGAIGAIVMLRRETTPPAPAVLNLSAVELRRFVAVPAGVGITSARVVDLPLGSANGSRLVPGPNDIDRIIELSVAPSAAATAWQQALRASANGGRQPTTAEWHRALRALAHPVDGTISAGTPVSLDMFAPIGAAGGWAIEDRAAQRIILLIERR